MGSNVGLVTWITDRGRFEGCRNASIPKHNEGRVKKQFLQSQRNRGRLLPKRNPKGSVVEFLAEGASKKKLLA